MEWIGRGMEGGVRGRMEVEVVGGGGRCRRDGMGGTGGKDGRDGKG